jgi:hypothetical protein
VSDNSPPQARTDNGTFGAKTADVVSGERSPNADLGSPDLEQSVAKPAATASAAADAEAAFSKLTQDRVLQLISTMIAPTTLVTALLFYFGWVRTNTLFQYFGVEANMLRYSTSDYLLRSVEASFIPMGAVIILTLAAFGAHQIVKVALLKTSSRGRRRFAIATATLGAAAVIRGLIGIAVPSIAARDFLVSPVCLGLGALLSVYAATLWQRSHPTDRAINAQGPQFWASVTPTRVLTGLIVVMSLFWATTEYAQAVGRGLATAIVHDLDRRPAVVLYSRQPLLLESPVKLDVLPDPSGNGYRYRYSGLRLLTESSGRVILLPDDWQRNKGPAIVLEENGLRLEMYPGSGYWQ